MKTITLTTQNGATIKVADKDGKLHILDSDNQITKDVLPTGTYSSGGLTFQVKDGQQVKNKFSAKAGVQPKAIKIPYVTIGQKMERGREDRKKEISDLRMAGKI